MSLSKEPKIAAKPAEERQQKCTRCRHHGIIVPRKGHTKHCPFLKCQCWKCHLVTRRARVTSLQQNPKNPQTIPGDSAEEPVTERCCSAPAPDESAHPSAASGDGAPERAATVRPGEESVAGPGPHTATPFNPSYSAGFGQTAPLPFIQFPFSMSGRYPSSYAPCPHYLLNTPWLPLMPAGLYNKDGPHGEPLMFPTSSHMPGITHSHQNILLIGSSSPYNHLRPPETSQEEQQPQPPLD